MNATSIAIAIPPVALFLAMGILSRIGNHSPVGRELKRKALHISIGLMALSFPTFLKSPTLIIAALGLVLGWLIAVRKNAALRRCFGSVLHDVRRKSLGEVYFAISIGGLLLLTQNEPLFFVIPILILTLADASAAIVGRIFPVGPLPEFARGKTMTGCAAFFAMAFVVSFWCLLSIADVQIAHAFLVATVVAVATCGAEAISRRGTDNLFVPAMAYLILLFSNIPDDAGQAIVVQLQHDFNALMAGP